MVFDPLEPLLSAFLGRLAQSQEALFGAGGAAAELEAVRAAAILAIETIHRSDAYYHNSEHTMLVTLVGQQIMLGRQLAEGAFPRGIGPTLRSRSCAMTSAMYAAPALGIKATQW